MTDTETKTTPQPGVRLEPRGPKSGAIPEVPEPPSFRFKRRLLGKPLHTDQLKHERLGKATALAVFASDNLSSAAYATEEILHVLIPAVALLAFSYVVPITIAMLVVLFFLILSYRQTIKEYPSAGGAYIVTKDNFGTIPAQVAGVALLIGYILTVAVSVSAGSGALASTFPVLKPFTVLIALLFIGVIAFGNLRGVRESGAVFAVPTYFFILNMALLLGIGFFKEFLGSGLPLAAEVYTPPPDAHVIPPESLGLTGFALAFVVMRAFASGGAAVTGVEAISNGVPAFKPPEWRNARITLVMMGSLLGVMFLGLSWFAHLTQVPPYEDNYPTVISQVGYVVLGGGAGLGKALWFSLQAATMLILFLAANTSYADFPRLAAFAAGDYFMPRQLTKRGHRLVFSNGILMLSVLAGLLVVITGAVVSRLIPLYAIGVFASFTLSQAGMARHHVKKREEGWQRGLVINAFGAFLSFVVLGIVAITKFSQGAWLVVVLVPLLVLLLTRLNRQYSGEIDVLEEDAKAAAEAPILPKHTVLVLVDNITKASARAIQYARTLTPDELRAVHVALDPEEADALASEWSRLALGRMPLELVECPDRRIDRAVLELVISEVADGETEVSILIPRREYAKFWHRLLHDRTSDNISKAIARVPHANVTFVPFHFTDVDRDGRPDQIPIEPTKYEFTARTDSLTDEQVPTRSDAEGLTAIRDVVWRDRVKVIGKVHAMRVRPWKQSAYLECTIEDDTGRLLVVFSGRRRIPGIALGTHMTVEGVVGEHRGHLAVLNPNYTLAPPEA
ncbi:MAG: DNA-binding protein [Alphaproteobacteria bacterium]|nr:MAG: DNA-binding protein [Alphaproteobacteria bacterium]